MKIIFIFLLILYVILFSPIKVNMEYIESNVIIVRLVLFEIFIIPFKYIIKEKIRLKHVRKFLLSMRDNKEEILKEMDSKNRFIKGIISHITINYIDIKYYTDEPFNVSSYYFVTSILGSILKHYFYIVGNENYKVKFDIRENLYFNFTISIKLYHILKELFKNMKNLKYIFGRRLSSGKSN